tara:strand:+ start:164 stop:463 length:300 start_codon:yes stop_codon:yes gene_type:complete
MEDFARLSTDQLVQFAENVMNPVFLDVSGPPQLRQARLASHVQVGKALTSHLASRANGPRKPRNLDKRQTLLATIKALDEWLAVNACPSNFNQSPARRG